MHHPSSLQRGRRINWHEISSGYPEPRECLAAFLALGAAEVLAGVKPANLLRVSRHTRACWPQQVSTVAGVWRGTALVPMVTMFGSKVAAAATLPGYSEPNTYMRQQEMEEKWQLID